MKGMSTTQIMRVKTVKLSTTYRKKKKKEQEIKEKIYIIFVFWQVLGTNLYAPKLYFLWFDHDRISVI
jgi:hypothetical protein